MNTRPRRRRKLVVRRQNFSQVISQTDKGLYIITPFLGKPNPADSKDVITQFKCGIGDKQGLFNRIKAYETIHVHGVYIIALIVPSRPGGSAEDFSKFLRKIEQYYFKMFEINGFKRSHDPAVWNRKERGEVFIGSFKKLMDILLAIENREDKFFKILRSEYFQHPEEIDTKFPNDFTKWIHPMRSVF